MNPQYYGYPMQTSVPMQFQQPVQQMQTAVPMPRLGLNGKFIQAETEIMPSEVPMDGSKSYFPSTDENYILVKYWDQNGKLQTKKYVLDTEQPIYPPQPDMSELINERFNRLEKMLKQKPHYIKKEGGQNAK